MRKVHVYVDGVVQAVGYRGFIKRHADELGIKGYVRNIEGGVEFIAEGEDEAVEQLIEFAREGPASAKITNLTVEPQTPNFIFTEFSIYP